jgi:hypothetical protein
MDEGGPPSITPVRHTHTRETYTHTRTHTHTHTHTHTRTHTQAHTNAPAGLEEAKGSLHHGTAVADEEVHGGVCLERERGEEGRTSRWWWWWWWYYIKIMYSNSKIHAYIFFKNNIHTHTHRKQYIHTHTRITHTSATHLPQQNQHPELARSVGEVKQHRGTQAPTAPSGGAPRCKVERLEVPDDGGGQGVGPVVFFLFFWGGEGGKKGGKLLVRD